MLTSKDYERIGRAVVDRLGAAIRSGGPPLSVDNADFVRHDTRGNTHISIAVDRYCAGCGLPANVEVVNGVLRISAQPDPLRVGDSLVGPRLV